MNDRTHAHDVMLMSLGLEPITDNALELSIDAGANATADALIERVCVVSAHALDLAIMTRNSRLINRVLANVNEISEFVIAYAAESDQPELAKKLIAKGGKIAEDNLVRAVTHRHFGFCACDAGHRMQHLVT